MPQTKKRELLLQQPRFVVYCPRIEGLPKVSNDGLVNMPPVRVNLLNNQQTLQLNKSKEPTFNSVTFQSLIFVFGGSFDHVT